MARNTYRLTGQDKKTIRSAACQIAGLRRCVLRVGVMTGDKAEFDSVNALLVAANRHEAQTIDYLSWSEFNTKSIPLDDNGNAVIDLLIYNVPPVGESDVDLRDYAAVYISGGKLEKISSTAHGKALEIVA